MEIKIREHTKNEVEISIDNQTVAEIVRQYLNANNIEFAAWRREHPTQPIIMRVHSSGKSVSGEIADAVNAIKKDMRAIANLLKKK